MSSEPSPAPAQAQAQSKDEEDSMPAVTSASEPPAAPAPVMPPLRAHNPPPTKLPSRPRKLRKLSPDSSASPKPRPPRAVVVARSLSAEGEIEAALRHLRSADPHLSRLIDTHQPPTFDAFQTPFLALTKSILYQQLAFKAGTSIYSRFLALCGGDHAVLPPAVLRLTPQQLRQIGVSARKATYLHDLARKYQNGILSDAAILNMDDKSLFTMLTMVNGIGSWSVHMFMIFSLHRPDVLPVNDLGVRKGVQLLYQLQDLPRPSQMDQLCDKWRPYRSVGAWYMWRLVEAKGTPSTSSPVVAASPTAIALPHPTQDQQMQPHFIDPINGMINAIGTNFTQLN